MNEKLINEACAGSKEAFVTLYGQYKDRLYRYALYRLGDPQDAEDAVSECVLAAWKSIGSLRNSKAFGSWIFKILSGCCASRLREVIASREKLECIYRDGPGSGNGHGHSPALGVELAEALSLLSEEEREIVLLSVITGMNSSEISEQTGIAAGTIRSKLSRSLAKMREFLS